LAYVGGAITLPGTIYKAIVGVVLVYAAWQLWRSARAGDEMREVREAPIAKMVPHGWGVASRFDIWTVDELVDLRRPSRPRVSSWPRSRTSRSAIGTTSSSTGLEAGAARGSAGSVRNVGEAGIPIIGYNFSSRRLGSQDGAPGVEGRVRPLRLRADAAGDGDPARDGLEHDL
jgi:hypothetical protein